VLTTLVLLPRAGCRCRCMQEGIAGQHMPTIVWCMTLCLLPHPLPNAGGLQLTTACCSPPRPAPLQLLTSSRDTFPLVIRLETVTDKGRREGHNLQELRWAMLGYGQSGVWKCKHVGGRRATPSKRWATVPLRLHAGRPLFACTLQWAARCSALFIADALLLGWSECCCKFE